MGIAGPQRANTVFPQRGNGGKPGPPSVPGDPAFFKGSLFELGNTGTYAGVEELYVGDAALRLRFMQRSALMRYPDVVDALIVPRGDGATLARPQRHWDDQRQNLTVWSARVARYKNLCSGARRLSWVGLRLSA